MEEKDFSTFCPLPWSHLYVGPEGSVAPCCVAKKISNINEGTIKEHWNNKILRELRLSMLSGKQHSFCDVCYKKENDGFWSTRQGMNLDLNMQHVKDNIVPLTKEDGSLDHFELSYIDLRFNNLCNFKCRSCNEYFSSQIASERIANKKTLGMINPKIMVNGVATGAFLNNKNLIDQFKEHYPTIERIYFAGGEPMIQAEHWEVLEDLVNNGLSKKIRLLYSTNASKTSFKGKSVADYWPHFKDVEVQASIDAEGRRAEYWRDGTIWPEVYENLKTFSKYANKVCIYSVINWVTIYSWIDLIKHLFSSKEIPIHRYGCWNLTGPVHFSLENIPEFKKDEIKVALDELLVFLKQYRTNQAKQVVEHVESIKKFMYYKQVVVNKMHPNFWRYDRHLDKTRDKDFFDYFPEHENMREYIDGIKK